MMLARASTRDLPIRGIASASRLGTLLAVVGVLLFVAWVYAPTLAFGLMWDDPLWYGRVVDKSFVELIAPMDDYHFYRPGIMLYNRLFLKSDGTFNVPIMHAVQVGWHLLNVALTFALGRALGLEARTALAASALVGLYPFSYQAVAWAAPQQPMTSALQNVAWLLFIAARRQRQKYVTSGLSLLCFSAALLVQESTAALSLLPLLIELVLCRRPGEGRQREKGWRAVPWLALVYPLVAAGFGAFWLQIPRKPGYTSIAFDMRSVLYVLQSWVFPLFGNPTGYDPGQQTASAVILALSGITLAWLVIAAYRSGQRQRILFWLASTFLGVAPAVVGLRYTYVMMAPRVLYNCNPGIAVLWACALVPPEAGSTVRHLWRVVGALALMLVLVQSVMLLGSLHQTYSDGTAHMAELTQSAQTEETRQLYINFPDRYFPKRPPYPLGDWRVMLAPASVINLEMFPTYVSGPSPQMLSRRMPWIDAGSRDAGPYDVNMRGDPVSADELYQLAREVDAVYLSRYHIDGSLELQRAGSLITDSSAGCGSASFGGVLCLQGAQVEQQSDQLYLTLTWSSISPAQPHDAIFVHLGQPGLPPVAQADGDLWLDMLPLPSLTTGDTVLEHRILPLSTEITPDQYEIRVGVYNRLTGERLPATTSHGDAVPDGAIVIGHYP